MVQMEGLESGSSLHPKQMKSAEVLVWPYRRRLGCLTMTMTLMGYRMVQWVSSSRSYYPEPFTVTTLG